MSDWYSRRDEHGLYREQQQLRRRLQSRALLLSFVCARARVRKWSTRSAPNLRRSALHIAYIFGVWFRFKKENERCPKETDKRKKEIRHLQNDVRYWWLTVFAMTLQNSIKYKILHPSKRVA